MSDHFRFPIPTATDLKASPALAEGTPRRRRMRHRITRVVFRHGEQLIVATLTPDGLEFRAKWSRRPVTLTPADIYDRMIFGQFLLPLAGSTGQSLPKDSPQQGDGGGGNG